MSTDQREKDAPARPAPDAVPPRIDAVHLLAGHREVILHHMGQDYRLRLTSNGKLILTK